MKLDLVTVIGLGLGLASMIVAFLMEGGHLYSLWGPTAAIIVLGGTFAATAVTYSMADVKRLPRIIILGFRGPVDRRAQAVTQIVQMAETARREGLLSLERVTKDIDNDFFRKSITLVVDGTDPDLTREILTTDVEAMEARHAHNYGILAAMGGYAPTMGIIGTVMGLVHVLSSLENPDELGHAIAVAFLAALYGIGTANLLWLPLGGKLKLRSEQEVVERSLIIEGALAIQAGDNPRIVRERVQAFLPPTMREMSEDDLPAGAATPATGSPAGAMPETGG